MKEYLVYHGGHWATVENPGIVSFAANGDTIELRGNKMDVEEWADTLRFSNAIHSSMKDGNVTFEYFISRNTYSSWTWFFEDDYEQYKDLFESVKGETVIVKIDPNRVR